MLALFLRWATIPTFVVFWTIETNEGQAHKTFAVFAIQLIWKKGPTFHFKWKKLMVGSWLMSLSGVPAKYVEYTTCP